MVAVQVISPHKDVQRSHTVLPHLFQVIILPPSAILPSALWSSFTSAVRIIKICPTYCPTSTELRASTAPNTHSGNASCNGIWPGTFDRLVCNSWFRWSEKAMKRFDTDEKALIHVVSNKDPFRWLWSAKYTINITNRLLRLTSAGETSGHFKDGLLGLVKGPSATIRISSASRHG